MEKQKKSIYGYLGLIPLLAFLSACGGGGSSNGQETSTGVFLDSPVAGLTYRTATQSGITNAAGEYKYLPGETVTFSVGGITLGQALAGPVVTPLTLVAGAVDATDPTVTNIVRLLLTLDGDADPSNGISISADVTAAAQNISIDFTTNNLSTDAGVLSLLATLPGTVLVDGTTAQNHFAATLAGQSKWGSMTWGYGTWKSNDS